MGRTWPQEKAIMDSMVGKAFVQLPGKPPQHRVLHEDAATGQKFRVCDVEMVFNDGLLIDAVKGLGEYRRSCAPNSPNAIALKIAEDLYGVRLEDAVPIFLQFPKATDEWPGARCN